MRITALAVRCPEAGEELARLHVTATLYAAAPGAVELRTTVEPGGAAHHTTAVVAVGANQVHWQVDVAQPPLWWPRALSPGGVPPTLVDVVVEVRPGPGGADDPPSDVAVRRTGLRQVRLHDFVLEVNGQRLFLKGANYGPTRMALGQATAAELERDVALAQEAGLDLLRLGDHGNRPELYEAADRTGLLVWQDLPAPARPSRAGRGQAVGQARATVVQLAHHPCIAVWCAHHEPVVLDARLTPQQSVRRRLRHQLLPRWYPSVLDAAVTRTLDDSRPVVARSGVLPHPAGGTDTHVGLGWYHGDERDLPRWLRRFPVLGRFAGELGVPSVPETADWMQPERWPRLDWEGLGRHHGLCKTVFDQRVPPADHATFGAWRAATQGYQAQVLRHQIEALRRLKYRPTGGFCFLSLADGHPAVSPAVLDHKRVPKLGWAAVQAVCAPVIVTADRLDAAYRPGAHVALDVHVVSDLRHPLAGCTVYAELTWPGGGHRWSFGGDVAADTVARVGTLSLVVPDAPGPLVLALRLEGPAAATATYEAAILPAP